MTKAKYEVWGNGWNIYSFVTTTRDAEDCMNLMLQRFGDTYKSLKVFQIIEGVKKLIYSSLTYRKPKRVQCSTTGEVYESARHYSDATKIAFTTVKRHLGKSTKPINPICIYYVENTTA